MKYLFVLFALAIGLLAGCSRVASVPRYAFTVDQFVAVALEYQGPHALIGVDTYGPTAKEFACVRSTQAAISQSDDMVPKGHTLVATCLHVAFGGPLSHGAAISVPIAGTPYEYVTIGVEYAGNGEFVGAQALHSSPDLKTCMREARDVIGSNYRDGHVAAGNSLLLYCTPIPVLEQGLKGEGGVV